MHLIVWVVLGGLLVAIVVLVGLAANALVRSINQRWRD
jgi:hypothetical protein